MRLIWAVIPILLIVSMIGIVGMQESFATCIQNTDWAYAPCIDTGELSHSEFYNAWYGYYDYKGADWMETKKVEMNQALEKEILKEWVADKRENRNVYSYYLSRNEIQSQFPTDSYDVRLEPNFIIPEGIPELFIYDDETANATLPTGKTIEGYAIQHEFTKVNLDAFYSDIILFNLFDKTITVYKIDQIGKFWYGGTTEYSDYRTVQITLHGEMISGNISYNHDFFTITPLDQNNLYILKQLDRSNSSDEPEGWEQTLPNKTISYNERIGYDSGNGFTFFFIFIVLIIGFTIFVIYYKKRRKVKL